MNDKELLVKQIIEDVPASRLPFTRANQPLTREALKAKLFLRMLQLRRKKF